MDFTDLGTGNNNKAKAVAEKAKRERLEREAKRKAEALTLKQSESAVRLQRWYRQRSRDQDGWNALIDLWDTWVGFIPKGAVTTATTATATSPVSSATAAADGGNGPSDNNAAAKSDRGNDESASTVTHARSASTSLSPWDYVRNIGVFVRFFSESSPGHLDRLAYPGRKTGSAKPSSTSTTTLSAPSSTTLPTDPSSVYISGPELILCVTFWDQKRWGKNPIVLAAAMESCERAADSLYIPRNTVSIRGKNRSIYRDITGTISQRDGSQAAVAILQRVKLINAIRERQLKHVNVDPVDVKSAQSMSLWLNALLRILIVSLMPSAAGAPASSSGGVESSDSQALDASLADLEVQRRVSNFICEVLSTPLLVATLDSRGVEMLCKANVLELTLKIMMKKDVCRKMILAHVEGELALFFLGNLVELFKAERRRRGLNNVSSPSAVVAPSSPAWGLKGGSSLSELEEDLVEVLIMLLDECRRHVSDKASNVARFHPVFEWYSGPILDVPPEFRNKLAQALSILWTRAFIESTFSSLLSFDFPIISNASKLPNKQQQRKFFEATPSSTGKDKMPSVQDPIVMNTMADTLRGCRLYISLMMTILPSRNLILNSLSWTPGLVSRLWSCMTTISLSNTNESLSQQTRGNRGIQFLASAFGSTGSSSSQQKCVDGFLAAASTLYPEREPMVPILALFCEACGILFLSLDDVDIYERQHPFSLDELSNMCIFLNGFCFTAYWNRAGGSAGGSIGSSSPSSGAGTMSVGKPINVIETARKLLISLYDTSSRRPFGVEKDRWIMMEVQSMNFVEQVRAGDARAVSIMNNMPHCVPFSVRVEIFRYWIQLDRSTLPGTYTTVTINRRTLLEDGFRLLHKLSAAQFKQTIRVKFINELGMAEAGIDHNGVFKEFLEEMCKRAFDTNFSLFRTTDDGNCVPSVTSFVQEDHLDLLAFVGRIFAKALYEGIVIDIPFAPFVYAKLLGRFNFLEDLPSLDPQLYKNLLFLKHYEGDAEDLGLNFTIDQSLFGELISKEIKPGGKAVAVTNENKYEYIHLVSDFRLNQECKEQFAAFIGGFRSMMHEKYICFFSPRELQTLMSGENIEFDVEDLRRNTVYEGGYFDQHPTIRSLWQILAEFKPNEKSAFLKFVTSCSNPPVGGFKHLEPSFTIRLVASNAPDESDPMGARQLGRTLKSMLGVGKEVARLPTAATCFNLLKLPTYKTKSSLRDKLLYAIHSNTGFELS
ncbi:Ubiquitin-protein ligase E3B [Blyttiomyces sp. JEL0837]|nr:Ubiquitin-protein ligase E3B [Blyttiomyces sp. JEL0837]